VIYAAATAVVAEFVVADNYYNLFTLYPWIIIISCPILSYLSSSSYYYYCYYY